MRRFLALFEDRHWQDLRPLTDVLPVPALAFGASYLAARWRRAVERLVPGASLLAVEGRAAVVAAWRDAPRPDADRPAPDDELLLANAAALPGTWLGPALEGSGPALWVADGRVAGARAPFGRASACLGRGGAGCEAALLGLGLPERAVETRFIRWPWDLIEWNLEALGADLAESPGDLAGEVHPQAVLYQRERIAVAGGARVEALAVLDARGGPIRIGPGATVMPHTTVIGPCDVGAGVELLGGYVGRSTIGPGCRIGGEVDACIWQGWANKRHQGFIGHSVVGEWANLGAMTTTSDLKNTYGRVRVWAGGREVDSGLAKVGSFVGAHVKTGIGTLLPTGAAIGTGSNLFGGGRFAPKHVPPFTWWDGERAVEHRLERLLATARVAMDRRERPLSAAEEAVLRALFEATSGERAPRAAEATVGPAP